MRIWKWFIGNETVQKCYNLLWSQVTETTSLGEKKTYSGFKLGGHPVEQWLISAFLTWKDTRDLRGEGIFLKANSKQPF